VTKTLELLDAAKANSGLRSDYKLALVLGVNTSTLTAYRKGRAYPSLPTVLRLAELADTDGDQAWLAVCVDRAVTDDDRETWRRIGKKLMALDNLPTHH
jgi:transcriptional regulator with XRE-family HTH domain